MQNALTYTLSGRLNTCHISCVIAISRLVTCYVFCRNDVGVDLGGMVAVFWSV